MLKDGGIYSYAREFKFHATRKWRADLAVCRHRRRPEAFDPRHSLLVEIEGITREGGRHQRMAGFEGDCEKYAEALIAGYALLRVTPKMVQDGRAMGYIDRYFGRA